MRTALALSLSLALAAPAALQVRQDRPERKPPVSKRTREDFAKLLKSMQGCWQLMELRIPGADVDGRLEVGYMTIAEDFMSVEIHMGFFDESSQMEQSYFQSGTYRLATDNRGFLLATTLIGSYFDDEERLIFEAPGNQRMYLPEVEVDRLTLVRAADGARYVFEKLKSSRDLDFYGRPLPEDEEEAGDDDREGEEPREPRRRRGG